MYVDCFNCRVKGLCAREINIQLDLMLLLIHTQNDAEFNDNCYSLIV